MCNFGAVKCKQWFIKIWMLGVICFTPGFLYAEENADSLLVSRVFDYQRNYAYCVEGYENNVYLKYSFFTDKRNFTLFLIPHMYSIAKGDRAYVGESYCRMIYKDLNDYELKRQVSVGNIAHYSKALPTVLPLPFPSQ